MSGATISRQFINRYRQAWLHSWQRRRTMTPPHRLRHEVQFLPAALALRDTPVHPAPQAIQRLLIAFSVIMLIWAYFGSIDVVATANGKIVPNGKSKVIQPSEIGVVKAIHVQDGRQVRKGDLLIELENHTTQADVLRLRAELLTARLDSARAQALLDAIEYHRMPESLGATVDGASEALLAAAYRWVLGQYAELETSLDQINSEIAKLTAEVRSGRAAVKVQQRRVPIARQLVADYRQLLDESAVPKHAYLQKEQERLDQERELEMQLGRVSELLATKRAAEHRRRHTLAQANRSALDALGDAEQRIETLTHDVNKAEHRDRLRRLRAPIDGTVQQLAVHTLGGVVTEAQPLMTIVPVDQLLEVEALLENKDIGFVREGQRVDLKIETFTFTKYGLIPGTVMTINRDAIEDEKLGWVFSVRVRLDKRDVQVADSRVPLAPGMAVTAEIKTDQRSVMSYFLSPLQRSVHESLGER